MGVRRRRRCSRCCRAVERPPARRRAALSWVGLAAIAVAAARLHPRTPFPGYAALLPVLGALAVIRAGAPARALGADAGSARSRPVQFLGDISYSVYLWHWPLIVLAPFVVDRRRHPDKVGDRSCSRILARLADQAPRRGPGPRRAAARRRAGRAGPSPARRAATAAVLAVTVAGAARTSQHQVRTRRAGAAARARRPPALLRRRRARPARIRARTRACALTVVPTPLEARQARNAPCTSIERAARVTRLRLRRRGRRATAHHRARRRQPRRALARRARASSPQRPALARPLDHAQRLPAVGGDAGSCRARALARCVQWNREVPRVARRAIPRCTRSSSPSTPAAGARRAAAATSSPPRSAGYRDAWNALPARSSTSSSSATPRRCAGTTPTCVEQAIDRHRRAGDGCAAPARLALPPDPAVAAARGADDRVCAPSTSRPSSATQRRCPPVIGGALVYKDVESHLTDVYATTLGPFLRREVDALMADWR